MSQNGQTHLKNLAAYALKGHLVAQLGHTSIITKIVYYELISANSNLFARIIFAFHLLFSHI